MFDSVIQVFMGKHALLAKHQKSWDQELEAEHLNADLKVLYL